jgi:hypothetical protein
LRNGNAEEFNEIGAIDRPLPEQPELDELEAALHPPL